MWECPVDIAKYQLNVPHDTVINAGNILFSDENAFVWTHAV